MRALILEKGVGENSGPSAELGELMSALTFHTLNEFRDLLLHPLLQGFTYSTIQQMAKQLDLEIVGFDFPELLYEKELAYRAKYPDDPNMLNAAQLDEFDTTDPTAFSGLYISFTCCKKK